VAEAALVPSRAELVEGARASVDFVVDAEQMRAFAELSGDFNPLHTDDGFARSKGFKGRVVYGALLVAKISQLIGMRLPGRHSVWASVSLDFRSPLYVGEAARVEAVVATFSEATGLVELSLSIRREGKLLAKGSAEVVVAQ
jgi:acyl dehydratase